MERLRVVNPTLYAWMYTNESVAVDFKNEFDERMYKSIVNDARNGITGCIRVMPYKRIDVSTEAIRGLSDVAMMHGSLRNLC
jgi:hypothetical protein